MNIIRMPVANHSKSFMPHLEGMRGAAIMLVLFFHLGATGIDSPVVLPGGYLGVDMFFVLSGYLLALGLSKQDESFIDFASKKALRIIWPMSIMMILVMTSCLFCMDFEDLKNIGANAIWSSFAANNIKLAKNGADYFGPDSTWNPLLHTWFVSVLLQIYVVFYIGSRLLKKFGSWKKYILIFIALISFSYAHCDDFRTLLLKTLHLPLWMGNPGSMYYSTVARLWEPLIGASLLFFPRIDNKACKLVLNAGSVVIIIASVCLISGWSMAFVCMASMIIIRYGSDNFMEYVYSNKLLRGIGKISFSIYLVHMPLMVCYKCITFSSLDHLSCIVVIMSCILLGWCFWRFCEKTRVTKKTVIVAWICVIIPACILLKTNGLKEYWNKDSNALTVPTYLQLNEEINEHVYKGFDKDKIWHYGGWRFETGWTSLPEEKQVRYMHRVGSDQAVPSFALIGDSHARHYVTGLDVLCKEKGAAGVNLTTIVVPFWNRELKEFQKDYYWNKEKAEAILSWLELHPEISHVIIGQLWDRAFDLSTDWNGKRVSNSNWEHNLPMLRQFVLRLSKMGKKVVIMAPLPFFEEKTPMRYFRWLKRNNLSEEDGKYDKCVSCEIVFIKKFGKILNYMKLMEEEKICSVIYPHRYLFKNGKALMQKDGLIIFRDNNHFSVIGSEKIIRSVWEQLSSMLNI